LDKEQIIKGQWGINIIVKLIFKYFLSIKASDPTLTFINLNSLVSTLATDLIMVSFENFNIKPADNKQTQPNS